MYDQLTDLDDLVVAKEELQAIYDYMQVSSSGTADDLHGLDTAITVLGKLIERLPNPDDEATYRIVTIEATVRTDSTQEARDFAWQLVNDGIIPFAARHAGEPHVVTAAVKSVA